MTIPPIHSRTRRAFTAVIAAAVLALGPLAPAAAFAAPAAAGSSVGVAAGAAAGSVRTEPGSPRSGPEASPSATSTPTERAARDGRVSLRPTTSSLGPGGELTIAWSVTNPGEETLPAGRATLSSSDRPIATRPRLEGWLSRSLELRLPTALASVEVPELAPGASYTPEPVTVTAEQLGLYTVYGNYPLRAYYRSGESEVEDRSTVLFDTGEPAGAVTTAVIVPITAPAGSSGLIPAEELEAMTAPGGALTRQLDQVEGLPVSLGVDPMIAASIRSLGSSAPESATAWLERLLASPHARFALQYGDSDAGLQAQAGRTELLAPISLVYGLLPGNFPELPVEPGPAEPEEEPTGDDSGTTGDESAAGEGTDTGEAGVGAEGSERPAEGAPSGGDASGQGADAPATTSPSPSPTEPPPAADFPTLEQLLDVGATASNLVWPSPNATVRGDLPVIFAGGLNTAILDSRSVTPGTGYTPGALRQVEDGSVLVTDYALSGALASAAEFPEDAARGIDELRRVLAAMGSEPGSADRVHVLALPRGWGENTTALATAIAALEALPEARIGDLAGARAQPSSVGELHENPIDPERVAAARELLAGEPEVAALARVIERPELLTGRTRAQVQSLTSVSWAADRAEWDAAVRTHRAGVGELLNAISIAPTEQFNMVSWQASLGFSVRNALPYPATVTLNIDGDNLRLSLEPEVTQTIPADTAQRFTVPVSARIGNGQTVLNLSLTTPEGVRIGQSTSVPVNVRADWETVGTTVLILLVVVLIGGGLFRTIMKRRRARLAGAPSGSGGANLEALRVERHKPDSGEGTH